MKSEGQIGKQDDYLIKMEAETDDKYGAYPYRREIRDLLNHGVINLDKPSGPSSHQVAAWIKDMLELEKVSHGGTLDPRVTGVLPVTLGQSIKTLRYIAHAKKEYVAMFRFHKDLEEERILEVIKEFSGKIYQTPPVRSAVKRKLRVREIFYIEIMEVDNRDYLLRIGCEAGTYIRQLAHDLGEALGIGGHMQDLRRTKSGVFNEEESANMHDVKDAYEYWKEDGDEKQLREIVQPMERLFEPIPTIVVRDSAIDAICHGAQLAAPGVVKIDTAVKKGEIVAFLSLKGEGIGLSTALMNAAEIQKCKEGQVAETLRLLMDPGVYPKSWKKEKKT